jgi:hypothetical protein
MWRFFWHLFLEALAFVRNFKMQKFLHFLEGKTKTKIKKNVSKQLIQNGRCYIQDGDQI